MSEKKELLIHRISITSDLHIYGGADGLSGVLVEIDFNNIEDDFESDYAVQASGEGYDKCDDISFHPEEVKIMAKKILNMIHGKQFVPVGE